jgi:hypothetical protein
VLLDLIRALLAAAVAGVLPGWFWARALCATADRAERLTYSVALSMALVPACALTQTALFGTGVTLPIAVSSVLLVLLGGLAALWRFGPAAGKGDPLFSPPMPPGVPALVLIPAAFGIALWAATGMPRGEPRFDLPMVFLVPTALLVFAAGLVHLLAPRRGEPAPPEPSLREPEAGTGGWWRLARYLALPAVLLVALVRGYLGPVLHDWPFIRGVDHYSHGVMANLMLTEGEIYPYLIYPPGFHTMTAMISRLSGLRPLEIFPVLGPALVLLPALALYALARRLWGWEYGVAAAGFSVVLGGTYYYYNDAMYPNLVTSQFLLVLAVAALCALYSSPSARPGLLLALLGSSVVLYHQVSSMYAAALLALVGVFFLPFLLLHDRRRGLALFFSLALLGSLSVVYAWDTYDLPEAVGGLLGLTEESATGDAVGMAVGTQVTYELGFLVGTMVSQPVAWLGILGAFLLLRGRLETPRALSYLTLLFWVLLLFVGTRTSLVGFPQRFGRDLGVPVAILAAVALVAVLRSLGPHRRPAAVFAASLAVLTVGSLVALQTVRSVQYATAPSIQMTITPEIAEAGEWLRQHNEGGNIMVSPHVNQVPSRMMLAMGEYSALQSFEIWQIRVPRDLPPTGPEPHMDVLLVVNDPDGEHVPELLEKHDVRYIVLYKSMPDRPTADYWKLFEARPDLYETAFENEDVLIVAPREALMDRAGAASPTL